MVLALGSAALVVRGGICRDASTLLEQIKDAIEDGDGPVLSVYCDEPMAGEDEDAVLERICRTALACGALKHGKVQVASASDVVALGIELVHDTSDGQAVNHFHATFQDPVAQSQVQSFIDVFGHPKPNPVPRGERNR